MIDSIMQFLAALLLFSSLILGLAFLANTILRRHTAELRHWIWVIAFGLLFVVPPAALWLPKFETRAAPLVWVNQAVPFADDAISLQAAPPTFDVNPNERGSAPTTESQQTLQSSFAVSIAWRQVLVSAYLAGVVLLLARILRLMLVTRSRLKGLKECTESEITATVHELSSATHAYKLRVLKDERSETPWTWGFLRPVVVIHGAFHAWSAADRRNALAHEIAHIERHDFLTTLLARSVLALYWFQPLVWLGLRAMRVESESACDDFVIRQNASAKAYAEQLLLLARTIHSPIPAEASISAMVYRKQLAPRISRILDSDTQRTRMTSSTRLAVVAFGCLIAIPPALLHSQQAGPDDAPGGSGSIAETPVEGGVLTEQQSIVTPEIPSGWEVFYGGGPDGLPAGCVEGVDKAMAEAGTDNMTVKCDGPVGLFGGLNQGFSAENFRGERVRLSASLKTENVEDVLAGNVPGPRGAPARDAKGLSGLWLRVGGANPALALVTDNMRDRPLTGTVDWTDFEAVVEVPRDATEIRIGFWIQGRGQLWISNVRFEVVDRSVPVTVISEPTGGGPRNLALD